MTIYISKEQADVMKQTPAITSEDGYVEATEWDIFENEYCYEDIEII